MLVKWSRELGDYVGDDDIMAAVLGRPPSTIRKHCKPWGVDMATGTWLYHAPAAEADLRDVTRRYAKKTREHPSTPLRQTLVPANVSNVEHVSPPDDALTRSFT